jgi:hypothetical protein
LKFHGTTNAANLDIANAIKVSTMYTLTQPHMNAFLIVPFLSKSNITRVMPTAKKDTKTPIMNVKGSVEKNKKNAASLGKTPPENPTDKNNK